MLTSQVKDFHKRPYYKALWDGVCLMSPYPTKVAAFEGQYCSPRTPSGERSPNDWAWEGSQQLLGRRAAQMPLLSVSVALAAAREEAEFHPASGLQGFHQRVLEPSSRAIKGTICEYRLSASASQRGRQLIWTAVP